MPKKKFSVEQIVSVLKQAEVSVPVAELIRKVGKGLVYRLYREEGLGLRKRPAGRWTSSRSTLRWQALPGSDRRGYLHA